MIKKISQYIESVELDENGQVKSLMKQRTFSVEQEPPFVKMYLDTIVQLSDISRSCSPILHAILEYMPFANKKQEFALTKRIKESIATDCKLSFKRVESALTELVKKEILFRTALSTYQVNPKYFGKGEWRDISKLRLEIDFTDKGKTIRGEVFKDEPKQLTN